MRCERYVVVRDEADHALLRSKSSRGLVVEDTPAFSRAAGDRLEPAPFLQGTADFVSLSEFPTPPRGVLFWRAAAQTLSVRRCPLLFCSETGITPSRSIAIDLLHTLYLGPMQIWCREIMWKFIESGVWGGGVHERDKLRVAAQSIKAELFSWYSTRRQAFPSENLTQLSNLSLGMVGKANAKRLKLKAMETYGLLLCS